MSQPPSKMLQFEPGAAARLKALREGVMIGVLDRSDGLIHLFEAAPKTDLAYNRFAGHVELVRHGVAGAESIGFSIHIREGEVQAFYRTSILNRDFEDFSIPYDMMLQLLNAIGLPRSRGFRFYPAEEMP
jgi:hypothetical protein